MSNVAYFSPWRPHGNRVSKTRFITLINIREEPRISENTRKEPRERERKKKKRERRSRPRPCTVCDQVMPRQRATRLRFDPLRSDPNLSLSLSLSLSLCCFLAVVKALNEIKASLGWTILMEMEIYCRGPASLAPLKTITESSPNCMLLSLSLLEFSQFDEFYSNF